MEEAEGRQRGGEGAAESGETRERRRSVAPRAPPFTNRHCSTATRQQQKETTFAEYSPL